MRNSILLVCVGLAAVGIALNAAVDSRVITHTGVNSAEALTRYIDNENGVVCYQAANSKAAFSCVKVREVPHGHR